MPQRLAQALIVMLALMGGATTSIAKTTVKAEVSVTSGKKTLVVMAMAKNGDANAQCDLGVMYFTGNGLTKNVQKAVYWTQKAADQGHLMAITNMGYAYLNGIGVTQDYGRARMAYEVAANRGYAHAQSDLGAMYFKGLGVPKDETIARQWFEKSANQGFARAQDNLAILIGGGEDDFPLKSYDLVTSAMWAILANNQGFGYADEHLKDLKAEMTPEQIQEAQARAAAFVAKPLNPPMMLK